MKTNKSFTKRIKVTKTGKLVVRKAGQNHFNAKESRIGRMARRRKGSMVMSTRSRRRFLPGTKTSN